MSEPADVYEPGASIGAPNQTPAIALYASGDRQHRNLDYHIKLDAYSRQRIKECLQVGKLSALDDAVRDIKSVIGVDSKNNDALRFIVSNLFVAWCTIGNPFVAVPMGKASYAKGERLHELKLKYQQVHEIVSALKKHEYIELHNGYFDAKKGCGKCTRIRAAWRLTGAFIKYALNIKTFKKDAPLVVLKDQHKKRINITRGRLAAEAKRFHPALISINEMLRGAEVQLRLSEDEFIQNFVIAREGKKEPCTPPNPCAIAYKRSFNVDYQHGGRFYGPWWQGIPSDLRKRITINGFPVVELDYKSLHPRLLYLSEGIQLSEDPYTIQPYGPPYRRLFKLMLNSGINAADAEGVRQAVRNGIRKDSALYADFSECMRDEWLKPAWAAMCKKHEPIARHLGMGAGLRLQRLDSDMAEHVMVSLKGQGIPVLGIHDSFIVPNIYEHELEMAMLEAARVIAGGVIPVENKMPENSQFGARFLRNSA